MAEPQRATCGKAHLFAGSSLAVLLLATGMPSAWAACSISYSNTTAAGCTNAATIDGIAIDNSTLTGAVDNTGMIGPNGISLSNNSWIAGGIVDSGTITGGISLDASSKISATSAAISIVGPSFTGGIFNAGKLLASNSAIIVRSVTSFGGGIKNSGTLSAGGIADVGVQFVSSFTGGISNSGKIVGASYGIFVSLSQGFAGGISNSGTISFDGNGVYVIAVGSFSGGILNSGTISARSSGIFVNATNFSGGISNSGMISARNTGVGINGVSTFSGGVTNAGVISSGPRGILISGVSSFFGTIANSGTISGTTGIDVTNSSAVSLFDSGAIVGTGGIAVDLSSNAAGNTFTLGPGYSIAGAVKGRGSDTFQLGGTGSGTFDLSTIGTQYTGFTTFNVVSGVWSVTNSFGQSQAWNVQGGTLAGTGALSSVDVASGATLEPGAIGVPGTVMTIKGNLTFQPGADYLVNISPTAASRTQVTGNVILNGVAEASLQPGSYSGRTTYTILDPPSISGTFAGLSILNAPGFGGTLTYTPTSVLLNLTAQLGRGQGLGVDVQNVATGINTAFNAGGTLPATFFPFFSQTGNRLSGTLTAIDGEAATGAERSGFELTDQFLGLMLDPFVAGRNGADWAASRAPQSAGGAALAPATGHWTFWGAGYGGSDHTSGNAAVGSNTIDAGTYGYAAGADYHVSPTTVLGFALSGGGSAWGLAEGLGGGHGTAVQGGVYAATQWGPAYVASSLAFANNWLQTERFALGDQLTAGFAAQDIGARAEAGYRFGLAALPGLTLSPYGALEAQDFRTPGYSETTPGFGGYGLSYQSSNAVDTRSELGLRLAETLALAPAPTVLWTRVAWAHDWVTTPSLGASFEALPNAGFTVFGAPIPHNSALVSTGLDIVLADGWSLIGKFDGEFASGTIILAGTGEIRKVW